MSLTSLVIMANRLPSNINIFIFTLIFLGCSRRLCHGEKDVEQADERDLDPERPSGNAVAFNLLKCNAIVFITMMFDLINQI